MTGRVKQYAETFVVGGGPAGSAFAITAAKAGMKVILCEQSKQAYHKVCGEFLSKETQTMLNKLGIKLDDYHSPSQHSLRLTAGRKIVETRLPFTGRSLSRKRMDEVLLEKAEETGVKVLRDTKVTHLEKGNDGKQAVISLSGGKKYKTDYMALATGASTVRGAGGRNITSLVGFKIMLSLTQAAQSELKNRVQLMAYDGGYQGILLIENDLASLAWIMNKDQAKTLSNDWAKHKMFLAAQSEIVGDLVAGSKTDWEKPVTVSGLQYGFVRRAVISDNVFPVGRQMAIIPSFTGDGLAIALATGIEAATAAANGISAAAYQQKMQHMLKPQFRWAKAMQPLFLNSLTRNVGLGLIKVIPGIVPFATNATRLRQIP